MRVREGAPSGILSRMDTRRIELYSRVGDHWVQWTVLLSLCVLLGCSNNSPSENPDAGDIYGQRTAFRYAEVAFLEVDVVSRQEWTFRDEARRHTVAFDRLELRVVAESLPPIRVLNYADFSDYNTSPGRLITAHVTRSHTFPDNVTVQSPPFDDRPQFARLDVGRRVIVALGFPISTVEPGQLLIERAWRVDPISRLVGESCLGMPTGTATTDVLDARAVLCPPQGSGTCDAGLLPADAS